MNRIVIIIAANLFYMVSAFAQDGCSGTMQNNGTSTTDANGCNALLSEGDGLGVTTSAFCCDPIDVENEDFSLTFDMIIGEEGGNFGDGFAFVLQNEGCTATGGTHGGLGFGAGTGTDCIGGPCNTTEASGSQTMFGVEFDWFDNSSGGASPIPNDGDDASGSDVCSETGALCSQEINIGLQFDNYESQGGSYTDPDDFTVYNEYDYQACMNRCLWSNQDEPWDATYSDSPPDTNTVTFTWNHTTETFTVIVNGTAIISAPVDMSAVLADPTNVYFGMTAATGGQGQTVTSCLVTTPLSIRSEKINANAKLFEGSVDISWEVIKSENISYFEIEKSFDKVAWEYNSSVSYDENIDESYMSMEYEIKDENFSKSQPYYKVIQYDKNNELSAFSNILEVNLLSEFYFKIENINNGELIVNSFNNLNDNKELQIFSTNGIAVNKRIVKLGDDSFSFKNLSAGIYIVQFSDGFEVESKKFIVK